jgi:hypothetical protein
VQTVRGVGYRIGPESGVGEVGKPDEQAG